MPGGKHQTLAVDATNLYIANYFGGTITAISKATRKSRVLAQGVRRPVRLVVDERHVYFASEADGTVRRVEKQGGPVEVLARGQSRQEHLALDETHVYWATRTPSGEHALMRALATPARRPRPRSSTSACARPPGSPSTIGTCTSPIVARVRSCA